MHTNRSRYVLPATPGLEDEQHAIEQSIIWSDWFATGEQRVSDWLTADHPKLWYTYDFGDSWEHEITLEKVIDADPFTLAKYLKGKRLGLEEDSRSYSLPDCTAIIKASDKPDSELWRTILRNEGKTKAKKLLARAKQEAVSKAPEHIRFTDPKERHKAARAMGMFD